MKKKPLCSFPFTCIIERVTKFYRRIVYQRVVPIIITTKILYMMGNADVSLATNVSIDTKIGCI